MKKLIFPVFVLFLVIDACWAQTPKGYDKNDFEKLKKFMQRNAAVGYGCDRDEVLNAELLLGQKNFYSWFQGGDAAWLQCLEDRFFGESSAVQWQEIQKGGDKRLVKINFSYIYDKLCEDVFLSDSLDFSGCTYLTNVECCYERLTHVNFAGCENLREVKLSWNNITSANFEKCEKIQYLFIDNNNLLLSQIILPKPPEYCFDFNNQNVSYSDYTLEWEHDELYLKINLSSELTSKFASLFKWYPEWGIDGTPSGNPDDKSGIFYFNFKKLQNSTIVSVTVYYEMMNGKKSYGSVKFDFNNITSWSTIRVTTYQQIKGAIVYVYWVRDGEYILIDTVDGFRPTTNGFTTNSLPAGEYIIRVDAVNYLPSYYSGGDFHAELWNKAKVIQLPGDGQEGQYITVFLKDRQRLKDEGVKIYGTLWVKEKSESLLKASARVLQNQTVVLQSSSSVATKASNNGPWYTVATTLTDEDGKYEFTSLPTGPYRIYVEIPGYVTTIPIILETGLTGTIFEDQDFLVDETDKTITAIVNPVMSDYLPDVGIQLSVYPNPVTDVVRINGLEGAYVVNIINMSGQIVTSITGSSPELSFHLANLPSGMYLLRIESQGRVRTVKLIKN